MGVQSEEGSYSASLEISALEKIDLAATYSLNVTNPYGSQIYMFSFSTEPTTSTQAPTTKGAIPPTDTSEAGSNTAGVVVVLLVLAIISAGSGVLFYRKRKAADGEMAPLTTP